jgi:type IV secretory pathway TrbL component
MEEKLASKEGGAATQAEVVLGATIKAMSAGGKGWQAGGAGGTGASDKEHSEGAQREIGRRDDLVQRIGG